MKKLLTILFVTGTLILSGCTGIPNGDAAPKEQAFFAGQLAGAIYKDTEGTQASETREAAKVAYYALVRVTDGESENALDSIIEEELGRLDSEVGKVLVLNYYKTAKDNLSARLGTTDLSLPILTEFRKGVDSVIK